jgi:hypothetical protein
VWEQIISKQLYPDQAIYVPATQRLHVLEMKEQKTNGSVDEKLQTCVFKKLIYQRLVESLKWEVTYSYVLCGDFFKHPKYRDVLQFIQDQGCRYYFDDIPPLGDLDLPS